MTRKIDLTEAELADIVLALIAEQSNLASCITHAEARGERALVRRWKDCKERMYQLERKLNREIYL